MIHRHRLELLLAAGVVAMAAGLTAIRPWPASPAQLANTTFIAPDIHGARSRTKAAIGGPVRKISGINGADPPHHRR